MKILLLGANGQLGKELERQLISVGSVSSFSRQSLDITNHAAVRATVRSIEPNIIINAAAYTAVDKAETNADLAYAVNAGAVSNLAQIARERCLWLIHYSTDYVFDGFKQSSYTETDTPNPINVYGASKLAGEAAIVNSGCQHFIFRTTWIVGKDGQNFAKVILRLAVQGNVLKVIDDQIGVPTSSALITRVTIDAVRAIIHGKAWPKGTYHLTPKGKTSWYGVAKTLISYAAQQQVSFHANAADIQAIKTEGYPTEAKRPMNSQLDTHKLQSELSFNLPHWKDDFLVVAKDIVARLGTV